MFDNTDSGKVRQIVYIDICGLGIPGRIPIKEWANAYTPNLKREAVVGNIVDVVITGMSQSVRQDNGNVKITKENERMKEQYPQKPIIADSDSLGGRLQTLGRYGLLWRRKYSCGEKGIFLYIPLHIGDLRCTLKGWISLFIMTLAGSPSARRGC